MKIHSEDKKDQAVIETKDHVEIDSSRRKLTKAGFIAPVIMSLSSKPVWAFNCTLSGMLSGNLSIDYDSKCNLPGLSRSYWIANDKQLCDPDDPNIDFRIFNFHDTFKLTDPIFAENTDLLAVLNGTSVVLEPNPFFCYGSNSDKSSYAVALKDAAAEAAAAWVNAKILPWYPANAFTVAEVISLFNDAAAIRTTPPTSCSISSDNLTGVGGLVEKLSGKNNPYP